MGAAPSTPSSTAIASTSTFFATSTSSFVPVASATPAAGPYLPVPYRDASTQQNVPARKDIETLSSTELTLFVLAMQQWQRVSASQTGGYFQVAGIHGAPHTYWDNAGGFQPANQGDKGAGYCRHGDQNFYLWHRPYMALVEQQMLGYAVNISNNWYAPQRSQYQAAAATLKFPYWDWAKSGSVPSSISGQTITVTSPTNGQSTSITNPLYSHTLVSDGNLGSGISVSSGSRTTRRGSNYVSNMASAGAQLRRGIALLFNTPNVCWNAFATYNTDESQQCTGTTNINSLESIHGSVHNTVAGTMANLDVSAFDPIFWLHHCNVDRLGAIWQAINPNTLVQPTYDGTSTFVTSPATRNDQSPFLPFRASQANTDWWTVSESYNTRTSGYTYPELSDNPSSSTALSRANAIYGNGRTQSAVRTSAKLRRDAVPRAADQPLSYPPSPEDLVPYASSLIASNGSFNEYSVSIEIKRSVAYGKSFDLHLFFGTVKDKDYINAYNRVGGFSVSQSSQSTSSKSVTGVVTITDALLNKLIAGGVKDLEPETVQKYCEAKLVWRLITTDGEDICSKAVDNGLVLQVKRTVVTPKDTQQAAIPVIAAPQVIADTTNNTVAKALPSGVAAASAAPSVASA